MSLGRPWGSVLGCFRGVGPVRASYLVFNCQRLPPVEVLDPAPDLEVEGDWLDPGWGWEGLGRSDG